MLHIDDFKKEKLQMRFGAGNAHLADSTRGPDSK